MRPENYPSEPAHLWEHFYQFSQIPRPSKAEQAVRQYVIEQAEGCGCEWRMDAQGNLVVSVPGSAGREQDAVVVIQNHLDMVTVKTADSPHDFTVDPLQLRVADGWLSARDTTLGADNGLGCAAAIALMTDDSLDHPPLELLFTVDEETGLGGALNLDASLISGQTMLNLDTEDWQELFVGCAGGGGWEFTRAFEPMPLSGEDAWQVELAGLAGGHSGIQIHEQLGNAIKLLAQWLNGEAGTRLIAAEIGVAHNVIPREGRLQFACEAGREEALRSSLAEFRETVLSYLPPDDGALSFSLSRVDATSALGEADTRLVLDLIALFPHGAQSYSLAQPADLVDTSVNLAIFTLEAGALFVEASYRFFNERESHPLQQSAASLARAFGLAVNPVVGYPGWQPDFDSTLLARATALHRQLFGVEPAVKAIHAGLECGILKDKKSDLDILSFGPTIRGAHSSRERVQIDTVAPFWHFLTALLADL